MTSTALGEHPIGEEVAGAVAAPTHAEGVRRRLTGAAPLIVLLAVAAGLRLFHLDTAYELHIDEVSYTRLSETVAAGEGVRLYGEPFFLHPPLFFWMLGGLMSVLGGPDLIADRIVAYRPFSVACSLVTCAALVTLVTRASTRTAGLVAGALFAVDAFAIRFDSRLFLEALAMAFAALGYLVLALRGRRPERAVAWAMAAGLLLGGAMLTKDSALLVFAPALLLAFLTRRALPRRSCVIALGTAGAAYAVYLLGLVVAGQFDPWLDEKTSGLRRFSGLDQATGFNREQSPTLGSRLVANLEQFSASYAVIVLGSLATAYVLRKLWHARGARADAALLTCYWQASSVLFLVYAKTLGTLEEQMFYFLLVPSFPVLCIAGSLLAEREPRPRWVRVLVVGVPLATVAFSLASWYRVHTTPSDGYLRLVDDVATKLPEGTTMAVTEDVAQFLLPKVRLGAWTRPEDFRRQGVDYVLVDEGLVEQGYGVATPALVTYLDRTATVVARYGPVEDESLVLYRLPSPPAPATR